MILVDPRVDYVAKRLLGSPADGALLIHFLNAILGLRGRRRIKRVVILNPFIKGEVADDKVSILDIRCEDQAGRVFNVEVQFRNHPALAGRLVYYAAGLVRDQLKVGEDYLRLNPSYVVCVLNGVWTRRTPDWHLRFRLFDEAHGLPLTDLVEIHLLELGKFRVPEGHLAGDDERWMWLFKHAVGREADEVAGLLGGAAFARAAEVLRTMSLDEAERIRADNRRRALMDHTSEATILTERGIRKGRRIGRKEGINLGRKEGLELGVALGQAQLLRSLLNVPEPTDEALAAMSVAELAAVAESLRQRLASRGGG